MSEQTLLQMLEAGIRKQARREALEEAAKAVEERTKVPPQRNAKDQWVEEIGAKCAAAIRALMEKE